ncbi:MAG: hypothetical protein HUJ72_10560 [Blautia sp.]|nr:hypothetical protein [Blautia sp.]
MTDLKVNIAGFIFLIHARYPDLPERCRDYVTDAKGADLEIAISDEEIAYEREKARREAELEAIPCEEYTPGQLEETAVYRKIAVYLSYQDACVFHGALIGLHGQGYLFTAKSGTGKTTHIRNWVQEFPETIIVNGDKPVLRMRNGRLMAYGTPWAGKEGYQENMAVELKAVILLKRGMDNRIRKLDFASAFPVLVSQTYRPEDGFGLKRVVELAGKMAKCTEFYELECTMDPVSARVAYAGIRDCDVR